MAASAFLAITVVPVLMGYLIRGKIKPEDKHPLSKILIRIYRPVIHFVLKHKVKTILVAVLIIVISLFPFSQIGSEFMPPLNEGDLLYMPTTLPGISITKAKELLQQTDKIIKSFPEVETVFGKIGRAETATADHDRNNHHPEGQIRVTAGHDHGQADRGNEQRRADSRTHQRLDHAD